MDLKKHHTFDKTKNILLEAIFYLATAKGDLRERLKSVDALYLEDKHFPNELQPKWNQVLKILSKFPSERNQKGEIIGTIQTNLNKMKNTTASKIATAIVELYEEISCLLVKDIL